MTKKYPLRTLTCAALLLAMDIVLARFTAIPLGYERISLQFLPDYMAGLLLGPVWGGLVTLGGDILGMLVQSGGLTINPLISLAALLVGVLSGLFLHKKRNELTYGKILIALIITQLIADIAIKSFALHLYFYQAVPFWQIAGVRFAVRAVYAPIQAAILLYVNRAVGKVWKE